MGLGARGKQRAEEQEGEVSLGTTDRGGLEMSAPNFLPNRTGDLPNAHQGLVQLTYAG